MAEYNLRRLRVADICGESRGNIRSLQADEFTPDLVCERRVRTEPPFSWSEKVARTTPAPAKDPDHGHQAEINEYVVPPDRIAVTEQYNRDHHGPCQRGQPDHPIRRSKLVRRHLHRHSKAGIERGRSG
jgi:hypothetical protein